MKRLILLLALCLAGTAYADFKRWDCSNSDVDSLEEVCSIGLTYQYSQCAFDFTVGTSALTDFDIKITTVTNEVTEYSTSGDYTTPTGYLFYTSGDLTTAGTSGSHSFVMDRLSTVNRIAVDAAGTNSVITGTMVCNDL